MHEGIAEAVEALERGSVVLFPTDTAYGLAVDASNDTAIKSLFELKGRPAHKPIHVVVRDMHTAEDYVEVSSLAQKLANVFLPGALTLVCKAKPSVSPLLTAGTGTLGIRIPDSEYTKELSQMFSRAYTATSANISGGTTPYTVEEAQESLGEHFSGLTVLDGGALEKGMLSTVVDVQGGMPIVLRSGAIPEERILRALEV